MGEDSVQKKLADAQLATQVKHSVQQIAKNINIVTQHTTRVNVEQLYNQSITTDDYNTLKRAINQLDHQLLYLKQKITRLKVASK
jgi:hypothetical protein